MSGRPLRGVGEGAGAEDVRQERSLPWAWWSGDRLGTTIPTRWGCFITKAPFLNDFVKQNHFEHHFLTGWFWASCLFVLILHLPAFQREEAIPLNKHWTAVLT